MKLKTRPSPTFDEALVKNNALAYWSQKDIKGQVVKNVLFGNEVCSVEAVLSEAFSLSREVEKLNFGINQVVLNFTRYLLRLLGVTVLVKCVKKKTSF